ncbi:MAG: indole-3-glycerol phosphate synthase [Cyclobacteriaceae bacterium]|nr:MAG: indole-3-glycerol phosphate synthase [Cyclobacteriaceae bacterium]
MLQQILNHKRTAVQERKRLVPESLLKSLPYFNRQCHSLRERLLARPGRAVIAEFKRRSPSNPRINPDAGLARVVSGYVQAGAVAVSVLTDEQYFGGSLDDLRQARKLVDVPLLRKDFIIDSYQLFEAKAYGADAVLLIGAALSAGEAKELATLAHELGMEVLLEIHNRQEWDQYRHTNADITGVNNRNLNTLQTNVDNSVELAKVFSPDVVRISESGLKHPSTALQLASLGYTGFLIGEHFMSQADPVKACADFINALDNDQL